MTVLVLVVCLSQDCPVAVGVNQVRIEIIVEQGTSDKVSMGHGVLYKNGDAEAFSFAHIA
jgi:hypothetical protein